MKRPRNHYNHFPRQSLVIMALFAATLLIVSLLPWLDSIAAKWGFVAAPGHIAWQTDLRAGQAESRKTGRLLLVDFQASWCPPCRLMDRTVWTDRSVAQIIHRHFIAVREDIDSPEGKTDARHFHVQVLPTILVLNSHGMIVNVAQSMGARQTRRFLTQSITHAERVGTRDQPAIPKSYPIHHSAAIAKQ